MTTKYNSMSRKEKQLIASQYPFKKDSDLFGNRYAIGAMEDENSLIEFKKQAHNEGVDLIKKAEYISTPNGIKSVIDLVLGQMDDDSYTAALELAKLDFKPLDILKEIFSIEATRVRDGISYEQELGLGLNQDTQSAINSLTSIVKTISELEEGRKLSIDFNTSLSGMISHLDLDTIEEEEDIDGGQKAISQ